MADEDSILGTSGKTQLPYEYQLEQQQIARKRSMAQALLQRGMQPQAAPLMFGRYAAHQGKLPAIANAIAAFMGQRGLGEAEEESTALMGKVGASEEQQRQAAVAQALAGARSKRATEMAKLIGGDRGAGWLQSDNPDNPIPAMPTPQPEFGTSPTGAGYVTVRNPDTGALEVRFEPKATTITNDVKLGGDVNAKAAEYFNYGGEGYKEGQGYARSLQSSQELLDTLEKNPKLGAGAEGFQFLRRWGETLGVPITETTTATELAKMQLGQKVIQRLGGSLGSHISNTDLEFMQSIQGMIGTDPEALRQLLLIEAKALMRKQNEINAQINTVAKRLPDSTALPRHMFNLKLSQRNADDLERLFKDQGFAPAPGMVPPTSRPAPAGRLKRVP